MANGWIRQIGYPLVELRSSATRSRNVRQPAQRRFFAEPGARRAGAATPWLVPVVLRFRDAAGVKEQRCCSPRERRGRRSAADGRGRLVPRQRRARAASTAPPTTPRRSRACLPAVGELRPAERMALVSDAWALVRAGEAPIEAFLDLVASLRRREDHVVLDELVGRLVGDRAPLPRRRAIASGSRRSWRELFGARRPRSSAGRRRRRPPRTTRSGCAGRSCCARWCCWRASRRPSPRRPRRLPAGRHA